MTKILGKIEIILTFLLISLGILAVISPAFSQQPEVPTYLFISVSPNPVGVGQTVYVMFWLDFPPPTAAGAGGDRWEGLTVTITKPDQTTETKGPYRSDAVGGAWFAFTPDKVGTYKLQAKFPGQTIAGVYYKPSQSRVIELTVQQQPIEAWPDYDLPKSYWTRPINAELREWYKIGGNWLMPGYDTPARPFDSGGAFAPFTRAPEAPHIVWTKELTFGGIVGGEFGYGWNYYTGMSYEMKFGPPVIINGRLFYNKFWFGTYEGATFPGVICLDLRTGETIWEKDDMPQITFGQIYSYESPNQHGAAAYLWTTTSSVWKMYDAYTGRLMTTFENASATITAPFAANAIFGPHGELLVYMLNGAKRWLAMWNSSAIPDLLGGPTGTSAWQWRPYNKKVDWRLGIQWNVSIPDVGGVQSLGWATPERVLLAEAVIPGTPYPTFVHVGYNATTGRVLWIQNRTNMGWGGGGPANPGLFFRGWLVTPREGVYMIFQKQTMQWHVFDLKTGNKLWTSEPLSKFTNTDWSMYDYIAQPAYGKLYVTGYSGCVTAFDLKTGKHLWTFDSGSSGLETPYGRWPFYGGILIADHKIYVANGEHSPGTPLWRGYNLYCIDADTGQLLWKLPGWFIGNSLAVADGYLVGYNGYDNRIYCIGKGKTSITLEAPSTAVPKGSSIVIRGKVMDESPSVKGTPCVADENMSAWMDYLVMQKPMPQNVKGVTVELYAISDAGETIRIGSTTTDPLNGGVFGIIWTPPDAGRYIITAVFPGSKSYWDSYASTVIGVTSAAAPAAAVEALQPWNILVTVLVIIAIVIGIVNLYVLRKRK